MKCPKPYRSAEANAKAYLRTHNVIDEYRNIINLNDFHKLNRHLTEQGVKNYGIKATWFTQNDIVGDSMLAVANKEAFEAVDYINGVRRNGNKIDVSNNEYIKQLVQQNQPQPLVQETEEKNNSIISDLQDMVFHEPTFNVFNDINNQSDVPAGGLAKLMNFKTTLLKKANDNLVRTTAKLKEVRNDAKEYERLNNHANDLRKHIEKLSEDITKIKKIDSRSPELIEPYIQYDLDRLENLVKSSDPKDNNEAKEIIDFIVAVGDFSSQANIIDNGHPIYDYNELFDKDGNFLLQPSITDPLKKWREEAENYKRELDAKRIKIFEDTFNKLPQIKQMFGDKKEFTLKELVENGLKDINWIDMMVMDISSGILSHSGLIPQAIKLVVNNKFEEYSSWSTKIVEGIDELLPQVEKRLKELGYGFGIPGVRGVKYDLFRQQYRNGNKTRELSSKFAVEYQDAKNRIIRDFWQAFKSADAFDGQQAYNLRSSAYRKRNGWINQNNLFIDPSLLSQVANDPEFASLVHLFSTDIDANDKHEQEIKDLVGDKYYQKIIDNQIKLVREYKVQLELKVQELLQSESKTSVDDLSEKAKLNLKSWDVSYSPFISAAYMKDGGKSILVGNRPAYPLDLRYNSYIPLKKVNGIDTNYYDTNYNIIEQDDILSQFYDVIYQATSGMLEMLDYETQKKLTATTIPLQEKNAIELFIQEDVSFYKAIGIGVKHNLINFLDNIKNIFGIKPEGVVSSEMLSGLNKHGDDKINDRFIEENVDKINNAFNIRASKFLSLYNQNRKKLYLGMTKDEMLNSRLNKLNKNTVITINKFNRADILRLLNPYLKANEPILFAKEGDDVAIGRAIYNATQNEIVSEHSFDLPKVIKFYVDSVAQYAARQEMLPLVQIMKQYYENIAKQQSTTSGNSIFNLGLGKEQTKGKRTQANKQIENWFERVVLGNYGLRNQYGITKLKLYNQAERKQLKELDEAISLEKDTTKLAELMNQREKIGKNFAASGVGDSLLNLTRFRSLAWNSVSGVNNFIAGQVDNSMASQIYLSNPDFIDTIRPIEMIYGNLMGIANKSMIPDKVAKAKLIMEKYDLLKDASNERQKASTKGAFSKLSRINPYYELKKGEEYNQTPLNIALLRDTPITDKNGNVSNVWDALEAEYNDVHKVWELKLLPEFRTEDNIANWEHAKGEQYYAFKNRATAVVTDTHGDFDPRSGMMAKSHQGGQFLLMFKTWMPRQFFIRFGVKQDRLSINKQDWKGRYWSHTPVSAAMQTSVLGLMVAGPVGFPIGFAVGYGAGMLTHVKTGVSVINELLTIHKLLLRKMLGFPINQISRLVSGKNLISNDVSKFYDTLESKEFTKDDFNRYMTNMQELALMLSYIGLLLLTKAMFWDDDNKTEEQKRKRKKHNLFANEFIKLGTEITSYMNLYEAYKSTKEAGPFRTVTDIIKTVVDFNNFIHGQDVIPTGSNAGESALGNQLQKTFLPGLFYKDLLGWGTQMDRQFEKTPFDKYFHSDEYNAKQEVQAERAKEKKALIDEGLEEEEVKKQLRHRLPRKKKHESYRQNLERHKQRQEQEQK